MSVKTDRPIVRCHCECPYWGQHDGSNVYICRCVCGREIPVCGACLEAGRRLSCGECDEEG